MPEVDSFIHQVLKISGWTEQNVFSNALVFRLTHGLNRVLDSIGTLELDGFKESPPELQKEVAQAKQSVLEFLRHAHTAQVGSEVPNVTKVTRFMFIEKPVLKTGHRVFLDLKADLRREWSIHLEQWRQQQRVYRPMRILDLKQRPIELSSIQQTQVKEALRNDLAAAVIEALGDIEACLVDFHLKQRLVTSTEYCMTLDHVPHELLSTVLQNQPQLNAWHNLYHLDRDVDDFDIDFLLDHRFMVLDTQYFDGDFKLKVLEAIEDIESTCDGLLIHGDNAAAMRLIQTRYLGEVDTIYIDPPYNTGLDTFAYRDSYSQQNWRSMMTERLKLSDALLKQTGVLFASINDNESRQLETLLKLIWGPERYLARLAIKVRHEDRILRKDIRIQEVLEDVHMVSKDKGFVPGRRPPKKDPMLQYVHEIQILTEKPQAVIQIEPYARIEVYHQSDYTLTKHSVGSKQYLKAYNIRGSLITQKGSASAFYEAHLRQRRSIDGEGALYKIIGMGTRGDGLGYRYVRQPFRESAQNGFYYQGYVERDHSLPMPNYYDLSEEWNRCTHEGGVSFRGGKKPQKLFQILEQIGQVKPDGILLDFFAGSGSSGQSVIEYNRRHHSNRKYILIERADYFETVLKNRIKKAVYASDWKKKSEPKGTGVSQLFKVLTLEPVDSLLKAIHRELNVSTVKEPLNPTVDLRHIGLPDDIKRPWGSHPQNKDTQDFDWVESFSLLLGLRVIRMGPSTTIDFKHLDTCIRFLPVIGWRPKSGGGRENLLVLWRDLGDDIDQDDAALRQWLSQSAFDWERIDGIYINGPTRVDFPVGPVHQIEALLPQLV